MSTETIFDELDGFSDSSTVIGIDKTREEYSKLFSRYMMYASSITDR